MFVPANDHTLNVELSGDPGCPALVLLHSLGTCSQVWDTQARAMAARRFVIRPDFRGHGLSEESHEPLTIERVLAQVYAIGSEQS